jgi:tRNA-binding protein
MEIPTNAILTWDEFSKVEMRVGTIVSAEDFKEVKNPAYKLVIDFGIYGKRKTSAQITHLYEPKELIGKQVIAVVNFPVKQIANFMSECLVLGGLGDNKEVTLIGPERKVENGTRIG